MALDFAQMQSWGQSVLVGKSVTLRELQPEDLPHLAAWWNDSGEGVFQQDRVALRPDENLKRMFESWSSNDSPGACGYSITKEATLVGHLAIWGISVPARIATLAIVIGPESQNKGYGRDAMQVALRLAFEEMGAHKVEVQAWDYNERAIHLYTSLGFVEEGRRRAAAFHRSTFHSQVQLGLLDEEYVRPPHP